MLLIYIINDLDDGIVNWIVKFTDNTKIFSRVKTLDQQKQLQDDLIALLQCCLKIGRCSQMWTNVKLCILDEILS